MTQQEEKQHQENLDDMHRRRITMHDGRYLIFYTFGEAESNDASRGPAKTVEPQQEIKTSEENNV